MVWPNGSAGPRRRARRGHAGDAKTRPAGKFRPRCLRQEEIARQAAQTVRRTAAATLPHECHGHVFHQRSHQALLSLKTNLPSHTHPASSSLAYDPAPYRNRPARVRVTLNPLSQLQPLGQGEIILSGVKSSTSTIFDFAPLADIAESGEKKRTRGPGGGFLIAASAGHVLQGLPEDPAERDKSHDLALHCYGRALSGSQEIKSQIPDQKFCASKADEVQTQAFIVKGRSTCCSGVNWESSERLRSRCATEKKPFPQRNRACLMRSKARPPGKDAKLRLRPRRIRAYLNVSSWPMFAGL